MTGQPPLMLCDENSLWGADLYIESTREVAGCDNRTISGTFLTKVFNGPYKEIKNWYKETADYAKSKGKVPKKIYAYYTTCPKCAKHYGENYTVMLVEV